MIVHVTYGRQGLDLDLPSDTHVVEPSDAPGLPDEAAAFRAAVREPIAAPALRELVGAHERVVIVTSDITRATPNHGLPGLFGSIHTSKTSAGVACTVRLTVNSIVFG